VRKASKVALGLHHLATFYDDDTDKDCENSGKEALTPKSEGNVASEQVRLSLTLCMTLYTSKINSIHANKRE